MKKFLVFNVLLFLLNINTFYGQTDLPNVISPSPEASSITKFVDMKINEYQGMIQQQIPLYQISDGTINLPISLNYQSGGFKVVESSSSIGLGWSLYAGGAVTRSVNGLPDDNSGTTKGFLTVSSEVDYDYLSHGEKNQTRYSYLQSIAQGCYDSQPDIFNFNFNGYSGKFHFDWDRNIIISSESEVTITPIQNNGNLSKIEGWIFKTPNGFTYTFRANETTTNIKSGTNLCYLAQDGFNSSWYLTKITDAIGKRSLFFEYDTYTIQDHNIIKSQSRTHPTGGNSQCGGTISGTLQYNSTNIDIGGRALRRIYSDTSPVEVLFVAGTNKVMDTSTDFYAIAEIQIKNRVQNTMIKKFKLTHSYETGRLTLKSIQEFGKTNVGLPPYTFFYHGSLPSRGSTKKDHWGYPNANSGQDLLPPYFIHTSGNKFASFGTADRSPNFEGSRNGILYKVVYPTGGYDVYTYEQNTYGHIGGLQIDEFEVNKANPQVNATGDSAHGCTSVVTDTDTKSFTIPANPANPQAKILTKVSGHVKKYTEDYFSAGKTPKAKLTDSQGNIIYQVSLTHNNINEYIELLPGQYTLSAEATWRDCDITSIDIARMSVLYDEPTNIRLYEKPAGGVRVASISKYNSNDELVLSQTYDYKDEQGYSSGFVHKEPNYLFDQESLVWVASGSGGYNIICQSIVALDADRSNSGMTTGGHLGYKKVTIIQKDGANGKTELNFVGASNIVSEAFPFPPSIDRNHSNGKIIVSKTKDRNGKTQKQLTKAYKIKEVFTNALKISFKGGTLFDEGNFVFGRYRILIGHSQTENEQTITKLHNEDFITTTAYKYNSSLQKLKEQTTQSTNKVERQVFFYPEDYTQLTGLTQKEINAYQSLVNDHRISKPIQNELYTKVGTDAERLSATSRITYVNTISTFHQTLQASIATAKNNGTLQTDIEFDKYDDKGNILQYKKTDGITTSFVWSYDKMYPVAKVENATFLEISVALGITETALKNFGTGSLNTLDNLRTALPNAMVSTYTYDPLIGKISETDPKGYTMYYQYDDLNRLRYVVDNDDKVIERINYNYIGQHPDPYDGIIFSITSSGAVSPGKPITFTAGALQNPNDYLYTWFVNGNQEQCDSATSFTKTFTNEGSYSITLVAYNTKTKRLLKSKPTPVIIRYSPLVTPIISANHTNILKGTVTTFTASSVGGGTENLRYEWYVNNVKQASTATTFAYTPDTAGTYNVYFKVIDNVSGRSVDSAIRKLYAYNPLTAANVSASNEHIVRGTTTTFFASGIGGGTELYGFEWFINDVQQPVTGTTLSYNFPNSGTYTVKFRLVDRGLENGYYQWGANAPVLKSYPGMVASTSQSHTSISGTNPSVSFSITSLTGGSGSRQISWKAYKSTNLSHALGSGSGTNFGFSNFSNGTHEYTIKATITDNLTGQQITKVMIVLATVTTGGGGGGNTGEQH
ncbi:hypothetical protein IWQ47_002194 [Aquimarina sp. EL_43]|uniref:PKD domain-containing protein n=1 Tax=unclassified Aquimarina TaxID=2627091 RepID=UPI0018CBDD8C|nr:MULTISPECIES: PKD domain-containing protein [unclassified Aquimarina]MBG6130718.1 hypothetical protein [Aquimarina sp. EL_35]MBG6151136.1 hypothetical protein [Aquimarina sp. EL_32]MBG6169120.1 hypothetical protein [Aquimarina sp. EL_43]